MHRYYFTLLAVFVSTTAQAQHLTCGKPPEFDNRLQNVETLKGDLTGKAQALVRLLGSVELSGKIESERRELYKSSDAAEAARSDAYLAYIFCVALMDDRKLSAVDKIKLIQEFRRPLLPAIPPPVVDLTPDVTTAAQTQVFLQSFVGQVKYSVSNLGWADDMTNVEYSLWAWTNGRLVQLDERRTPYMAKGGYSGSDFMKAPFGTGKMVVCVSYLFKKKRVNVIDFYSNETMPSAERQVGLMSKFRASVTQVDGPNDLCKSMPGAVAGLI
ncbi:hypothetical protein [Bradyrhizobium sp. WSM3983]|uniref:hypothetical protein n=1 Tax=Bradyrhizobium sp. WSM3983 TaxID=1038867 RepID=UPI0012EB468A|nr:hypothetical protein [Bradyrhizobium sp. WSM3983]